MREISDLIEFENENSNVDFKAIQYKKEMYEGFLKDIMAMANSISKDDKFIIIGVKHKHNSDRIYLGITDEFVDDASFQQLVDANIEPHINFNYYPYEFEGKTFGIFHIKDCTDPPYMMKKDFGNLKLGDSYIRKGSFQKRLTRKDIDNHQQILKKNDISNQINVSLFEDKIVHEYTFPTIKIALPSEFYRKRIEAVISEKEKELKNNPYQLGHFFHSGHSSMYGSSYENRDLPTLRTNLESVSQTYIENDEYYLNEEIACKINFYILNDSSEFLEDATVEILIPANDEYIVRDSIYSKPYSSHPLINTPPRIASWEEINYPSVELKNGFYKINVEIGNVKHKLPVQVLKVPIRLVNIIHTNKIEIEIDVKVFGKNIINPINQKLKVEL